MIIRSFDLTSPQLLKPEIT